MKKSYLIVGAVGFGLVFLSFIINFFFSFNASRAANSFLSELSAGRSAQAYQMTGKVYREVTSEKEFRRMTRRWGLRDFQSLDDWESQSGGGQVTISANVKTKSGDHVSLLIGLAKEDGHWRIARLQGPPRPPYRYSSIKSIRYRRPVSGPNPDLATRKVPAPTSEEVERLVESTLASLDKAMANGDFSEFHGTVSHEWQEETPINVFERRLNRQEGEKLRLSEVSQEKPIFDPAPTVERGVLDARGKYLLPDNCLEFHMKYIQESAEWKLIELWFGVRPRTPEEDEEEAEEVSPAIQRVGPAQSPGRTGGQAG